MSVIDIILIKELITSPTTVNSEYTSEIIDISNRRDEFSIQIVYDNGSSVDMTLHLEVSNNKIDFSTMSDQDITDDTGSHIFDVTGGTGTSYLRIRIEVNAGSIDLQNILYKAKRNH